jgi:ribosomal protein L12E/L44/L45/RPP1/RPP2
VTTRPTSESEGRPATEAANACYVYGVVDADARLPEELSGVGGGHVSLVRHGELAAVVSGIAPDRPLGTRDDLVAHDGVVGGLARETTMLPLRFGAVVTDPDALVEEMLEPYHDWFATVLEDLRGTREFTVTGTYVEDVVLREVLEENPEIADLRERVREVPEDASYYDRIRLGELIVKVLEDKRREDTDELLRTLEPHAAAVAPRSPSGEDAAAEAAFLVADRRLEEFEEAVEELGERWSGRVRLRMVGPLAPYDFVPAPPEPAVPTEEGA